MMRKPRAALGGFVDLLWFYEGYAQPHAMERLLPDGGMELVINLSEDEIRVYDPRDTSRDLRRLAHRTHQSRAADRVGQISTIFRRALRAE